MKLLGRLGPAVALLLLAGCGDKRAVEPSETPAGASSAPLAVPETGSAAASAQVQPPAAFMQCRSCHSVEPGKNGIGATLHGIFGKQAASVEGFNYSPALKQSGIVWDRESLDRWLSGPMQMVPGTRMVISVPNAEARAAIIDYLEALD